MATRYLAYETWRKDGGPERRFAVPNLRVLTTAPTRRRLDSLKKVALKAAAPSGFFLFAEEKSVTLEKPGNVLGSVWEKAGDKAGSTDLVSLLA